MHVRERAAPRRLFYIFLKGDGIMPVQLADYGVAIFALALIAWIVVTVFAPRKRDPDLVKVISDNTQALTELAVLIKQQSELAFVNVILIHWPRKSDPPALV